MRSSVNTSPRIETVPPPGFGSSPDPDWFGSISAASSLDGLLMHRGFPLLIECVAWTALSDYNSRTYRNARFTPLRVRVPMRPRRRRMRLRCIVASFCSRTREAIFRPVDANSGSLGSSRCSASAAPMSERLVTNARTMSSPSGRPTINAGRSFWPERSVKGKLTRTTSSRRSLAATRGKLPARADVAPYGLPVGFAVEVRLVRQPVERAATRGQLRGFMCPHAPGGVQPGEVVDVVLDDPGDRCAAPRRVPPQRLMLLVAELDVKLAHRHPGAPW